MFNYTDEYVEKLVFYPACSNCGWECLESYFSKDEAFKALCPNCGNNNLDIEEDYV